MSNRLNSAYAGADSLDLLADLVAQSHAGTTYERGWYTGAWNLSFALGSSRGFHVVTHGRVHVRTPDGAVTTLHEGDLVLVSVPHELATDLSRPALPFDPEGGDLPLAGSDDGDVCLLCGAYLLHDAATHPLFSNLPPLIVVRAGDDPAVESLVALLDRELEARAPGSRTVADRLIDALLLYVLRGFLAVACPRQLGWLRALRDPVLGRALALMHREYAGDWTLASLARASGTSRASLARHFAADVGVTPMHYLTQRRLEAARRMLASTTHSLSEVAEQVGYASPFSLSKAFKRHYGKSPTQFVARSDEAAPSPGCSMD